MASVSVCSALLCMTLVLKHSISHSSSVTVTVELTFWAKIPSPCLKLLILVLYPSPSLGNTPHLFFIYWKWLENVSEVSFMSHAVCEISVKGRQPRVRESAGLCARGSFLGWCRNSQVRRRKKFIKQKWC